MTVLYVHGGLPLKRAHDFLIRELMYRDVKAVKVGPHGIEITHEPLRAFSDQDVADMMSMSEAAMTL